MIFGSIFAGPCFHRILIDFGTILEAIWEGFVIRWVFFSHLKNDSDFRAHFRAPRGAPGSPREPGEHTAKLAKILPAPKGNVPVT